MYEYIVGYTDAHNLAPHIFFNKVQYNIYVARYLAGKSADYKKGWIQGIKDRVNEARREGARI